MVGQKRQENEWSEIDRTYKSLRATVNLTCPVGDIPDHGSGRVMSGCRVENHGPRPTRRMCGSGLGRVKNHGPCPTRRTCGPGWVLSGFGFLVIIFGLSRVGSGYFLSSGENFGPRPTRLTVGSGRVFFEWVGSGRVYWVGQPMIRYSWRLQSSFTMFLILIVIGVCPFHALVGVFLWHFSFFWCLEAVLPKHWEHATGT
jgi:hypothetical protein